MIVGAHGRTGKGACLAGILLALPACAGGDAGGRGASAGASWTSAGTDGPTDNPGGGDDDDDDNADGTSGDDDDDDDDAKFDLGTQPDSTLPVEEGCTKVDFLFVIDNSQSMENEQANLIDNFPSFIDGIQNTLESVETYHVGVVTSDAYIENTAVPGCAVLGGLVTRTGGEYSSNAVCGPYADGNNFMTDADDLAGRFGCAAQVGTSGDGTERPMDALVGAVSPALGGAGGCNEDFLRDDALLVTVIITDEWDGPNDPESPGSSGTPQDWYDALVDAKQGIEENVVVLSLLNYAGGQCPPSAAEQDGLNIVHFTQMFGDNGFLGGVCEADYGPIFNDAIGVIDTACDNYVPPG